MDSKRATVLSKGKTQAGDQKKVHWALKLEEIVYFSPAETEGKATDSVMKRLKVKARAFKDKRLAAFFDVFDDELIHRLQGLFEIVVGKISGQHDEMSTEELTDYQWNEVSGLFEGYRQVQ